MNKVLWLCSWWPSQQRPSYGIFNTNWARLLPAEVLHAVWLPPLSNPKDYYLLEDGLRSRVVVAPIGSLPTHQALHQFRTVHLISPSVWGIAWMARARLAGAHCIFSDHSVGSLGSWRSLTAKQRAQYQAASRLSHRLSVLNGDQAATFGIVGLGRRKHTCVVPNVAHSTFLRYANQRVQLKQNQVQTGGYKFIHASSLLDSQKNVSILIRAFARLQADMPSARLLIAGSGNDEQTLRALAAELLPHNHEDLWLGHLTQNQLAEQFVQADCLVMPSAREVDSTVTTEALCMRLPVLSTDIAGMRTKVTRGRGWILLQPSVDSLYMRMRATALQGTRLAPAYDREPAFFPDAVRRSFLEMYDS